MASQDIAAGATQFWIALASSQLDPPGAATPHPVPAWDTALPASLPIEEILTLQETSEAVAA